MRRFDLCLLLILVIALVAALVSVSLRTIDSAERLLLPELNRKAEVVGQSLASLVAQAASYDMRLDELVGVDEVLATALARGSEFGYVALLGPDGDIRALAQRDAAEAIETMPKVEIPVLRAGRVYARIAIGTPLAVAETLVHDLWLDVAVILLVSVLVTVELVSFVFGLDIGLAMRGAARRLEALRRGDLRPHPGVPGRGPIAGFVAIVDRRIAALRDRQAQLRRVAEQRGDAATLAELEALDRCFHLSTTRADPPIGLNAVRAPLFLFFFAEEMTRPFLPSFIGRLATPVAGLSHELVISLPIVLFMAIVALTQPGLGGLTERFGRGRCFRAGAALAVIGFAGTAYASDLLELLLFRSLTAFGYATVFVAAQGHIIDHTNRGNRARGLAILVTAIMVAGLCGPPIGGILADRLGDRSAFLVAAVLGLGALACAYVSLPADQPRAQATRIGLGVKATWQVLRRPALAALLVGTALPAKMMLTGLCFYLVPLELARDGFEQASIGRILMLYALAMLLLVPQVARLSDGAGQRPRFVFAGGIIGALSVLHLLLWPQPWGMALAVLQLGIAQALSITPQSALVGELGRHFAPEVPESTLYGVFRLVERFGNALGPLLAAWLLGAYGGTTAALAIGALVGLGTLLFGLAATLQRGLAKRSQPSEVT